MRQFFILSALLFCAPCTWASTRLSCPGGLDPEVAAAARLLNRILQDRFLPPDLLATAVQEYGNPLTSPAPRGSTLALKEGLAGLLSKLNSQQLGVLSVEVKRMIADFTVRETAVAAAKNEAQPMFSPELMYVKDNLSDPKDRQMFWHYAQSGELQVVHYHPLQMLLRVYSPYSEIPIIDRTLGHPTFSRRENRFSLLSLRDGRLLLAASVQNRETRERQLFVHDASADVSRQIDVAHVYTSVQLLQSPDGRPYVVAVGGNILSIFAIEPELKLLWSHRFVGNLSKLDIFTSNTSRVLATIVERDTILHLFDPLTDKVEKLLESQRFIEQTKGVVIGSHDYAIAVYETPPGKISILTSNSAKRMKVPTPFRLNWGGWKVTPDGQTLFAASMTTENKSGRLLVFDPRHPLKKWRTSETKISRVNWIERQGQPYVMHTYCDSQETCRVSLISLRDDTAPLELVTPGIAPGIDNLSLVDTAVLPMFVAGFRPTFSSHGAFNVYLSPQGRLENPAFAGQGRIVLPPTSDRSGDIFIATEEVKPNFEVGPVHIYRLVKHGN